MTEAAATQPPTLSDEQCHRIASLLLSARPQPTSEEADCD